MDLVIARMIHVLSIVLWIGGVGFVATVLFPTIRRLFPPDRRLAEFLRLEHRFAAQARLVVALGGASGMYMIWRSDGWSRFSVLTSWWLDAMVLLWLAFAAMLYVIEPLYLQRRVEAVASGRDSGGLFDRMERFHRVMLAASLLTLLGAVGGSHGLFAQ